jgi:ribose transport system permease protein
MGEIAMQGGKCSLTGTIFAVILLGRAVQRVAILNVNSFWRDIAQGSSLSSR